MSFIGAVWRGECRCAEPFEPPHRRRARYFYEPLKLSAPFGRVSHPFWLPGMATPRLSGIVRYVIAHATRPASPSRLRQASPMKVVIHSGGYGTRLQEE